MPRVDDRHHADAERGADRLLLAGKKVSRAPGPGCACCKDADEALAKHGRKKTQASLEAIAAVAELTLDSEARRCARIKDPLKQGEAIAEVAERLGLRKRGLTRAFRAEVAKYGEKAADDGGIEAVPPVEDVIPWPEPVAGAEVLNAVVTQIYRHVNLPLAAAHAVALWAAFSHGLDRFWFNPRLAICSPVKRCGKTTLIEILNGLVARAKSTSGVTPAVVFRMIDLWKPTYLIDEADGYLPQNEELRAVLNSGHTRTGASVDRSVKNTDGDWKPGSFSTWCPLVVAGIGRLPTTLDDRSIKIRMQRKPRSVKLVRFRADRTTGITEFGRKLARFVQDNQIALGEADVEPPVRLNDRAADNWRPMFAIAAVAGGRWPERAAAAAVALEQPDADGEAAGAVKLFTSEILSALLAMKERPWPECNHGRALSERGFASLLKAFGINTSKNVRKPGKKQAEGYALDEFLDVFFRYLPSFSEIAVPASQGGKTPRETAAYTGTDFSDLPSHHPSQSVPESVPDGADAPRTAGNGADTEAEHVIAEIAAGQRCASCACAFGDEVSELIGDRRYHPGDCAGKAQPKRKRRRVKSDADVAPSTEGL
jgi:putative DNA primase/helicase